MGVIGAIKRLNLYAAVLKAIPKLAHFGRNGADGESALDWPVGVSQPQHIVEVDANAIAGAGVAFRLFGEPLRLVEDV